jgi:hypothetical protein
MRYSKFFCGDCGREFFPCEEGCGPIGAAQLCPGCLERRAPWIQAVVDAAFNAGLWERAVRDIEERLPDAREAAICFKCGCAVDPDDPDLDRCCRACEEESAARSCDDGEAEREYKRLLAQV